MKLLPALVNGLDVTQRQITLWEEKRGACEVCELAVRNHQPFNRRPRAVTTQRPLDLVHMDVCGPMPSARDSSRYIVTFLDDYSKYSIVRFVRTKGVVSLVVIGVLQAMATQLSVPVKQLRSDRGTEFCNQELEAYCTERGIVHTLSAPYTPQQNGAAERLNQTLQKGARALLVGSGLDPEAHWPLAVAAACYLRVRMPVCGRRLTPYELFFGVRPRVSNLRVFGSIAFVQIPDHAREHKFGPVAQRGRLVGWTQEGNYRVLLDDGRLVDSRHVTFDERPPDAAAAAAAAFPDSSDSDEDSPPAAAAGVAGPPAGLPPLGAAAAQPGAAQPAAGEQQPGELPEPGELPDPGEPQQHGPGGSNGQQRQQQQVAAEPHSSNSTGSNNTEHSAQQTDLTLPAGGGAAAAGDGADAGYGAEAAEAAAEAAADGLDQGGGGGSIAAGSEPPELRRSGRQRQAPERLTSSQLGTCSVVMKVQLLAVANELPAVDPSWAGGDEPTYEQVLGRKDLVCWKEAMEAEMAQLAALSVYSLEEPPPVLGVRWVFKIKRDSAGRAVTYKARLVVKGYQQVEGRDFVETWAPTGRLASARMLLAITATFDLELQQLDVTTAFLYGELEDGGPVIYVDPPPGFTLGGPGVKLRLRKALYGLRQAPRAWYAKLKEVLESCGFTESDADPGLFVKRSAAGTMYIIVHVDDMLLAGNSKVQLATFKAFKIKDLGNARFYLGMDIVRDRTARTIKLAQTQYTRDVLEQYGMDDSAPVSTPMQEGERLLRATNTSVKQRLLTDKAAHLYRSLVGSLMYLANCTRPDIALAVGCLARQMAGPTEAHMQAAKRVLCYLKGTPTLGLVYGGNGLVLSGDVKYGKFVLAYADADFAGCLDTRRSTTAYAVCANGTLTAWQSKLQPTVAASTTEAEYMAASSAAREMLWQRKLLWDFGMLGKKATILLGDNQGALALIRNPMHSQQSKHIDVLYHFVREHVALGELEVRYVPTAEMVADILTKPLPPAKFLELRDKLGLR